MSLPQLPVGGKILQGRYQVSETGEIGRGQFGVVYEVEEAHTGLKFAAKFLDVRGPSEAQARRELDVIEAVRKVGGHQNLIRVKEVGDDWGCPVVIMELAQESLADWDRRVRGQNLDEGARRRRLTFFTQQVADGLDFLGFYHLVHHDVKPGNVVLVGGVAKLTDFGLSKPLTPPVTEQSIGWTPLYAAPEFLQGEGGSRPYTSDQYSLAVTYHLLRTGHLPFKKWRDAGAVKKATTAELILAHVENAIDVSSLGPNEGAAVARALSKQPEDRFPSCREFAEAVANGVETDSWKPAQQAVRRTAIKPGVWAAGGLVVVLLAALAGLLIPPLLGTAATPPSPTGFARDEEVAALRALVDDQRNQLHALGRRTDMLRAGADYSKLFIAAREAAEKREYVTARDLLALTRPADRGIEFAYLERRLKECEANSDRDPRGGLVAPSRKQDVEGDVDAVLFRPGGKQLLTVENGNRLVLRSADFRTADWLENVHPAGVSGVNFDPHGVLLVSTDVEGSAHLWVVHTTAERVKELPWANPPGGAQISAVGWGMIGRVLALQTASGRVQLFQIEALKASPFGEFEAFADVKKEKALEELEKRVGNRYYHPLIVDDRRGGRYELITSYSTLAPLSSRIRAFQVLAVRLGGKMTSELAVDNPTRRGLLWLSPSGDGERFVSCSADGTIRVWHTDSLTPLRTHPQPDLPVQVEFAGTPERLVVRAIDHARVIDPDSGQVLLRLPVPGAKDVAWAPGARWMSWDQKSGQLAVTAERSVCVWQFAN